MNTPEYNRYGEFGDNKALVFVGGYGDDKVTNSELLLKLSKHIKKDVYSFTLKDGINAPFRSQINDLTNLCKFLINEQEVKTIDIACTSDGAVSSTFVLLDKGVEPYISKILYLDPALYYLDDMETRPVNDWKGYMKFNPEKAMYGEAIREANFRATLYVVHFSLRNYSKAGYKENRLERGTDSKDMFPRMNAESIKQFWSCVPEKNKGFYKEVNNLPHAFMRDGDVEKNIDSVIELVHEIM